MKGHRVVPDHSHQHRQRHTTQSICPRPGERDLVVREWSDCPPATREAARPPVAMECHESPPTTRGAALPPVARERHDCPPTTRGSGTAAWGEGGARLQTVDMCALHVVLAVIRVHRHQQQQHRRSQQQARQRQQQLQEPTQATQQHPANKRRFRGQHGPPRRPQPKVFANGSRWHLRG